ncbi:MAG: GNAT family N-acetyltransferase [Chloroflexota bacterium]|nr:GNAT family N-acetyltransferase [Chloroflexota bacterium]
MSYRLRPYRPSDAKAVVDVINASSMQTVGFNRAVVDAFGNVWSHRFVPFSSEKVVVVDVRDRVVAYAYFTSEEDHIVAETEASIHPDYWRQGLETRLLEWAEERARECSRNAPPGIRTVLQTSLYQMEQDAIQLFTDYGYTPVREWVHLVLEMDRPPVVTTLPSPLTLRQMDLENDWGIAGPAMDEAYADHWGAIPPGSYEIERGITDQIGEDVPEDPVYSNAPGYCFLILEGDTVAGGILCNARLVERADTGRVGSLFVRPRYRRQGIGRTLMLAAFEAFWENGFRRVITDTDARSFTEAPRLYQGLGMRPYRIEFTYEKEIRPGREVRLLG